MQTQVRTFRVPESLWLAIQAAAKEKGLVASEILRRAAGEYAPVKQAAEQEREAA